MQAGNIVSKDKARKEAKCKQCKEKFIKEKMMKVPAGLFCTTDCCLKFIADKAETDRMNKVKKFINPEPRKKPRKLSDMKIKDLIIKLQELCQKYARIRDHDLDCITCDKSKYDTDKWDGAHFISKGNHSAIKFNMWNINKSCSQCNRFDTAKHHSKYEAALIDRIGLDKVVWLLENKNNIVRYEKDYLIRFINLARKKIKMKKARQ